jgi:hypothetical protein
MGDQVRQPLVFYGEFPHLVQLLSKTQVLLLQPEPRLVSNGHPTCHSDDCCGAKDA